MKFILRITMKTHSEF